MRPGQDAEPGAVIDLKAGEKMVQAFPGEQRSGLEPRLSGDRRERKHTPPDVFVERRQDRDTAARQRSTRCRRDIARPQRRSLGHVTGVGVWTRRAAPDGLDGKESDRRKMAQLPMPPHYRKSTVHHVHDGIEFKRTKGFNPCPEAHNHDGVWKCPHPEHWDPAIVGAEVVAGTDDGADT